MRLYSLRNAAQATPFLESSIEPDDRRYDYATINRSPAMDVLKHSWQSRTQGALDGHIVWLHDGFAVSVPPQAIVVRGSLTILVKSYAEAASLFVHLPTATDRI